MHQCKTISPTNLIITFPIWYLFRNIISCELHKTLLTSNSIRNYFLLLSWNIAMCYNNSAITSTFKSYVLLFSDVAILFCTPGIFIRYGTRPFLFLSNIPKWNFIKTHCLELYLFLNYFLFSYLFLLPFPYFLTILNLGLVLFLPTLCSCLLAHAPGNIKYDWVILLLLNDCH